MYIVDKEYRAAFNSIVAASRPRAGFSSPATSTFILVSLDVDAICAARLLHDLLKIEYVNNTIIPVANYVELAATADRLADEKARTVILINLGGNIDLVEQFPGLPATSVIHLIDSHRPIHMNNLFQNHSLAASMIRAGSDNYRGPMPDFLNVNVEEVGVVVWLDKEGEETCDRMKEVFEALQFAPPDSDTDSDSEEEIEEEEMEDQDDGSSRPSKRSKNSQDPLTALEKGKRRRFREREHKYYNSGSFSGFSVANQVYLLATLVKRVDEDSVWLAILGLSYQFITQTIDRDRYEQYTKLLTPEVQRLSSAVPNPDPTVSSGPNDRSIRPSEELRFCLFRHWNLYESMLHSGYVAGRMKLWKERGTKNLSGMLAKMGYSLQQSKETYAHMDTDLKTRLFANMDEHGPHYGLTDLTYPSFVRKSGFRSDISASDAVEGLTAILEAATGVRLNFGNVLGDENVGAEEWSEGIKKWVDKGDGNKENRRPPAARDDEDEKDPSQDWPIKNFWLAWDALHKDTSLLRAALPLSMALHRSVTAQGAYLLDKQAIQSFKSYRLAVIKEGPYLEVFRHPATLHRLALWLVDAVRDLIGQGGTTSIKGKNLPFVVACLDQKTQFFTVVGVVGAAEFGDVRKNTFGLDFEAAAVATAATTTAASFDSHTVLLHAPNFAKFLQAVALHQALRIM